jgi:hypothetical protein
MFMIRRFFLTAFLCVLALGCSKSETPLPKGGVEVTLEPKGKEGKIQAKLPPPNPD